MSIMLKLALLWRSGLQALANRRPVRVIDADAARGVAPRPYLVRYYLCQIGPLRFYLHKFLDSDPGFDLHNHPFRSASLILAGQYIELRKEGSDADEQVRHRTAFSFARISLATLHRVILPVNALAPSENCHAFGVPVWTLFITGARVQPWGFLRQKKIEVAARQSSDADPWWRRVPLGRDEPRSYPRVF